MSREREREKVSAPSGDLRIQQQNPQARACLLTKAALAGGTWCGCWTWFQQALELNVQAGGAGQSPTSHFLFAGGGGHVLGNGPRTLHILANHLPVLL